MSAPATNLQMQSSLKADGNLYLSLADAPLAEPTADQVVIRIDAAPINPSDLGSMVGPADISRMQTDRVGGDLRVIIPVPEDAMNALAAKVGKAFAAGVEGAGVVVAAGSSPEAQALIGKVVSVSSGAMYAQYRVADIGDLMVMKDGTTPIEAASAFINPMTALGMVETMRREGHCALVHTAAASNLGQMLNRLCLADGVPLVNIVRSVPQVELLQGIGAQHVVNSSAPTFLEDLARAIAATGATLCFDVIGGGPLLSHILSAMEADQTAKLTGYSRYGSSVHKQAYICGLLDTRPTELAHGFGMAWGVGGWLLPNFLDRIGSAAVARLRDRVTDEITTTFASRYTRTISLREALEPAIIAAYHRRATGEKYLIAPQA